MLTNHLNLMLTDESETKMTFLDWRTLINGVNCNSNMELIDNAIAALSNSVGGKADGFTFDADTGVLQLTSGGELIPNASVQIGAKNDSLPDVTQSDAGKFMRVSENGEWFAGTLTDEDKNELVSMVIASLPNGEEMNF